MAAHSSILAWRILWTEEPGAVQSMGCTETDTTLQVTLNTGSLCFEEYKDGLEKTLFPLLLILKCLQLRRILGPLWRVLALLYPRGSPWFCFFLFTSKP